MPGGDGGRFGAGDGGGTLRLKVPVLLLGSFQVQAKGVHALDMCSASLAVEVGKKWGHEFVNGMLQQYAAAVVLHGDMQRKEPVPAEAQVHETREVGGEEDSGERDEGDEGKDGG